MTTPEEQTARAREAEFKQNACDALIVRIGVAQVCEIVMEYMIQPQSWDLTKLQTQDVATTASVGVLVTRDLPKRPTEALGRCTWLRPDRPLCPGEGVAMLFEIPSDSKGRPFSLRVGAGDGRFEYDSLWMRCSSGPTIVHRADDVVVGKMGPITQLRRIEMRRGECNIEVTLVFEGSESLTAKLSGNGVRFPAFGVCYASAGADPIGWRIAIVNIPP